MKSIYSMIVLALLFAFLTQCGHEITPDDRVSSTNLDSLFDAAYVASNGFEDLDRTKEISDGKPARVITDIIGDKDWKWKGKDFLSDMWPTPPLYHKDDAGGYITLPNMMNVRWASDEFTEIHPPFDVYVVLRDLDAVLYEGYFAVWLGLRNRGDHLALNGADREGDLAKTVLEYNKITIIRIRYDGNKSRLWLNNVEVPGGPVDVGKTGIRGLGYGTNSHVNHQDFYAMWVKYGTLSNAEHKIVYDQLAKKYKPGVYPNKPFANNIKVEWKEGGWIANYEYVNLLGIEEDLTKTEYQWYYFPNEIGLDATAILGGGIKSSKKVLVRSDFPLEFPLPHDSKEGNLIMVTVKVYDKAGNSWRALRSQFAFDNNPN